MAEETVVKEPLTSEMIAAGEELTRRSYTTGLDVVASLWWYTSDANQWRLLIASPQVDREGPLKVYSTIQGLLSRDPDKVPGLSMQNISVVGINDPLIRLLKTALRTGKGLHRIRFSRNVINNVFVEDAFINFII